MSSALITVYPNEELDLSKTICMINNVGNRVYVTSRYLSKRLAISLNDKDTFNDCQIMWFADSKYTNTLDNVGINFSLTADSPSICVVDRIKDIIKHQFESTKARGKIYSEVTVESLFTETLRSKKDGSSQFEDKGYGIPMKCVGKFNYAKANAKSEQYLPSIILVDAVSREETVLSKQESCDYIKNITDNMHMMSADGTNDGNHNGKIRAQICVSIESSIATDGTNCLKKGIYDMETKQFYFDHKADPKLYSTPFRITSMKIEV